MGKHNDLTLANKGWEKYLGVLYTGSLWMFKKRGLGGSASYPGNFIPQVVEQTMLRYSKRGDIIADMFAGSETSAYVASQLGRTYIGCDLRPQSALTDCADARTWDPGCQARLVYLHPPYADMIDYNQKLGARAGDLSLGWTEFLREFRKVADNAYRITENGGFAVVVMADPYKPMPGSPKRIKQQIPLAFFCALAMMEAGFYLKQDNIKNFGDEVANKNKDANIWFLRSLIGDFAVLEHEHVLVFKKEKTPCPSILALLTTLLAPSAASPIAPTAP